MPLTMLSGSASRVYRRVWGGEGGAGTLDGKGLASKSCTCAWIGPKRAAKARSMTRSKAREVRIQHACGIARNKSESPPGCRR